jgi:hypothetical protein
MVLPRATVPIPEIDVPIILGSIRFFFHRDARGKLDNLAIDNALKGVYATGLYQEVNIKQTDAHVIVTVVEALVINHVTFEAINTSRMIS